MKYWMLMSFILAIFSIGWMSSGQVTAQHDVVLPQRLSDSQGLVSLRAPEGWYLSAEETDEQIILIAAATADRAATWQGAGEPILHIYIDPIEDHETLINKTAKDHGLVGLEFDASPSTLAGIPATEYYAITDDIHAGIWIVQFGDAPLNVRIVAVASPALWDPTFMADLIASIQLLPQQATVPKGWSASIRAPQGWEQSEFSSFIQWTAPDNSQFAGTDVWFQAGFRQDLIGQGEAPFVLRSLGVNYVQQVDETASVETSLGGLPAATLPFESFTHTGYSYHAIGGSDFGTANLIARAPLGEWTENHQYLVEAMAASVQIVPPTADAAPVGLRTGYRAPDFGGTFADGSTFNLEDFAGQLVFVHFWFVDCPYCRTENPHWQALHEAYGEDIVFLAINAIDPLSYIDVYMGAEGYTFPVVLDNGALHDLFQVSAFPTTFVVGPDGVIVQAARGSISERTMQNLVEQYVVD